jgi:hypothetical protein
MIQCLVDVLHPTCDPQSILRILNMKLLNIAASLGCAVILLLPASPVQAQSSPLLTGESSFTDWNQQAPGVRHKITLADLPQPKPDESVANFPTVIPRPKGRRARRSSGIQGDSVCRW